MVRIKKRAKLRLRKNSIFLGLIKKYKRYSFGRKQIELSPHKYALSFDFFKSNHIRILHVVYIFNGLHAWSHNKLIKYSKSYNLVQYYAQNSLSNFYNNIKPMNNVIINKTQNMIIFSRPRKQIFLMFFKSKPVFIFTGGLMRIVMNEKRKSSKKLYKVAVSLIKLFTILLIKRNFFSSGYLKLINVGTLRNKILQSLLKLKQFFKIHYVIIKFSIDFTAQKFETRRAIKKYIKKRFKVR